MSERTLVTGFGPFLEVKENPSAMLAEALGRPYEVLEVSYDAVEDFIFHLDPTTFDRLLLLGVAPSRSHICAELFARNTYGTRPDFRGSLRSGPIQQGEPLLVGTTLFGEEPLSEVLVNNSQVRLSLDAGSYLCNFTYYKALMAFPSKQVGFLHVPPLCAIGLNEQIEVVSDLLHTVEGSYALR
jgi:pyrrolidone-carboxylate peptidase